MTSEMKQEVARPVQVGGVPVPYDYGDDTGAGMETSASELMVPFLNVLQAKSPEVEREQIPGAKAGFIHETISNRVWDGKTGLVFLPIMKEEKYVQWHPRDQGGGWVGQFDPESDNVRRMLAKVGGRPMGKIYLGEKGKSDELVQTFYLYGFILDDEGKQDEGGLAIVPFWSTKIAIYRSWLTKLRQLKMNPEPPLYAHRIRLTTVFEERKAGTSFNFRISPLREENWVKSLIDPKTEEALWTMAKEARETIASGMVKVAFDTQRKDGDETDESGKPLF